MQDVRQQLKSQEQQVSKIYEKLVQHEQQFWKIDEKLVQQEQQLLKIDEKLVQQELQFFSINGKFDQLSADIKKCLEHQTTQYATQRRFVFDGDIRANHASTGVCSHFAE